MPYTITRPHSFIRLACLGFRPSVVIGFIIPSVLYTLYSLIISPLAVIPLLILLLSLIIRYSRWGLAKAEARSTDSEWDAFVNAGLAVRTDHAACADPAGWLASSLPALVESSRPAQWLESLQIPFQQPIPLTLATPEQARDFAARFETAALGLITAQLADSSGTQGSGGLAAMGRVVLHGKAHSLIFRQPTDDTMIFFLFRVELAGAVASILYGGTHFIRRAAATGDKARKKRLSDDDVATVPVFETHWFLNLCGLSYIPFVGFCMLPAGLLRFSIESFADAPYNWWCFGELACWKMVDEFRTCVQWPGLQPDRTAALAELDYMARLVQHDLLRELQAARVSEPSMGDTPPVQREHRSTDKSSYL